MLICPTDKNQDVFMTRMDDEDIVISGYLRKSPPENKFKVSSVSDYVKCRVII